MPDQTNAPARGGRRPATTRQEIEHVAFGLFEDRGFELTTVDDIAAAAGIGRRTFFRYFPSKNDVPWGDFHGELDRMRARFAGCPAELPVMDALRAVVAGFNRIDQAEERWHRRRMTLILTVPALQAHATLRYADWRRVVAEFVAARLALPVDDLLPQALAHAALGVAVAAYERWLATPGAGLSALMEDALAALASGFQVRGPATTRTRG
ncbi:mycofactocin system transcriptional regulator [Amycolatopsis sp. H20-H5]|uniref:mycofactocin system transcriptional regulator n=1 Tax=Amycolatopsis sp. H20-H5 TaxID=3046309 RepID=UPI002DBA9D4B|nr:mycofactocin system transcriptional regulator [Amycolatopsis sp. H20-H5]MEC3977307.1 mycofactocin system transcriptional regulator [Amycolatopsis sp. H20-H5]